MTTFTEQDLPDEPATDKLLVLPEGVRLRERVTPVDGIPGDLTASPEGNEPSGLTLRITHALLDDDNAVAKDDAARYRISPAHEVTFTDDALARLGDEAAVEAALREAREHAAEKAAQVFKGRELVKTALLARIKKG